MSNETDALKDNVQATKEHAANSFGQLKDDAVRVAQSAADMGRAGVAQAKDQYNNVVAQAKDQYENVKDQVRTKLTDGTEVVRDAAYKARARGNDLVGQVQHRIEENPLQAVAIAAGVGVILGVLLRR